VKPPYPTAAAFFPPDPTIPRLKAAAAGCKGCPLYANATQTVFGEGSAHAAVMLVGETPGDQEDLQGRPFVGPAGRLLDRCLAAAGIDRRRAYVTNVVKHFKWVPRGKKRLHSKPGSLEIRACRPWLDEEIALVRPRVLVCLGATAAKALLGADFKVSVDRGRAIESPLAPFVLATVHPSALLRGDDETREQEIERFTADLKVAAAVAKQAVG
jgi:uracil-DNA glycosylase family protein